MPAGLHLITLQGLALQGSAGDAVLVALLMLARAAALLRSLPEDGSRRLTEAAAALEKQRRNVPTSGPGRSAGDGSLPSARALPWH